MPSRIDRLLVAAIENDPTLEIVYTTAVTPDSYSRTIEDGVSVYFVHPMHRGVVEDLKRRGVRRDG